MRLKLSHCCTQWAGEHVKYRLRSIWWLPTPTTSTPSRSLTATLSRNKTSCMKEYVFTEYSRNLESPWTSKCCGALNQRMLREQVCRGTAGRETFENFPNGHEVDVFIGARRGTSPGGGALATARTSSTVTWPGSPFIVEREHQRRLSEPTTPAPATSFKDEDVAGDKGSSYEGDQIQGQRDRQGHRSASIALANDISAARTKRGHNQEITNFGCATRDW